MRLLVTRPQAQADAWVARLRERGVDAAALPLLAIEPASDNSACTAAWRDLATQALVMFVSPNAVLRFFAVRPDDAAWPAGTLAGSTGPGTTEALSAQGVPRASIAEPDRAAARFDAEALWQRLRGQDWAGRAALIVRGEGGRDWLADTLRAAGATVTFVEAYRRAAPQLDAPTRARLDAVLARPDAHLWLFSSSEAVRQLPDLAPGANWAEAHALATHPRIAQAARALGIADVTVVPPALDDIVSAWTRSLQSRAP